jgi:alpha-beta hydrolase superfamily lysophospholipase/SAM-dependent methyltransferase
MATARLARPASPSPAARTVPAGRSAPQPTRPRFTLSEHSFRSADGTALFYRAWRPAAPAGKVLVLFHRGHEHSGRWADVVEALAPEGFTVCAWDARGNGLSAGPRDDATHFGCYARDAELFVRHLAETEQVQMEDIAVVGHSVGAAIVAAWIHDYAPRLRAAVLAAPAFRIRLYLPFAVPLLRIAQRLGVMQVVPSYVKARVLTHDPFQRRRHQQDRLISHAISSRVLLDLHDTATRLIEDAPAIRVPTLLLVAGSDWVVSAAPQRKFFARLGSPVKRIEALPGYYHDVYHDTNAARPLAATREFIDAAFAQRCNDAPLLDADQKGYTFDEYQQLSRPLTPLSQKWIAYKLFALFLRTVGRLSDGIRLGWQSGFNSGRTLDYVYRNHPQGRTALGRLIDRHYLNGSGWRGIRIRRQLLERAVARAIEDTHARTGSVHVVDIAAGAGRYLLETLKRLESLHPTAELRDMEPKNLDEGRALARSLGVTNVSFVRADAFDSSSADRVHVPADIVIVAGLYELVPDNTRIRASLEALAAAVPDGGLLIYTNQPWHPQLELIARGLFDWDGKPWVMRRRTQVEMDDVVRAAGFSKVQMEIDPCGMFTVSVARRVR